MQDTPSPRENAQRQLLAFLSAYPSVFRGVESGLRPMPKGGKVRFVSFAVEGLAELSISIFAVTNVTVSATGPRAQRLAAIYTGVDALVEKLRNEFGIPSAAAAMRSLRGAFCVFEGPNASGKSTLLALVAERMRNLSMDVVEAREPGGTVIGEAFRTFVKDPAVPKDDYSTALGFAMQRNLHLVQIVDPACAAGRTVLCDRYTPSTRVLQVELGKLTLEQRDTIGRINAGFRSPELIVFVIPSVETLLTRRSNRAGDVDAQERAATLERDTYLRVAGDYDNAIVLQPKDGETPEQTFESLVSALCGVAAHTRAA